MTELPELTPAIIDGEDGILANWVEDEITNFATTDRDLVDLRREIQLQVEMLDAITNCWQQMIVVEHLLRMREIFIGQHLVRVAFEAGVRSATRGTP